MSCATSWLPAFVAADRFFTPCSKCSLHHSAREATLNYWDMEGQQELCSVCLSDSPRENVIQVRRSSYHDVVKVCDITRLADTSGIQSYVINGSKVLFLRRRPQPRPPKGAVGASQCVVCSRHLQDISLYCSLQCKLDSQAGVKNVSLRSMAPYKGVTTMADSRSSGSGSGPETPSHLMALRTLQDLGSDSDSATDSLFQQKRRKGLPRRAPME